MAKVIAVSVREQIFDRKSTLEYPIRPATFRSTFRQRQRERSKQFKLIAQKAIESTYGRVDTRPIVNEGKAKSKKHYSKYDGLFARTTQLRHPAKGDVCASVESTEFGGHIRLDVDFLKPKQQEIGAKIEVIGLQKYLPEFDDLTLQAYFDSEEGIFHIWQEIEDSLVSRSQFFTLIDIYGHYANRGDVVNVKSSFTFSRAGPFERAIQFFSQSKNCGYFIDECSAWRLMNIDSGDVKSVVSKMRALRFDLRTSITHPIVGANRIICTYPFPLLSPRALVKSRATLNIEREAQMALAI